MSNQKVLLLISGFLALTLGSFIWYVATWESRKGGGETTFFILPNNLPPEAPALATGTML